MDILDEYQEFQLVQQAILSVLIVAFAIAAVFLLAQYILNALAYRRLTNREDIEKGKVLSWIPVLQMYCLGKGADNANIGRNKYTSYGVTLMVVSIFEFLLSCVGAVLFLRPLFFVISNRDAIFNAAISNNADAVQNTLYNIFISSSISLWVLGAVLLLIAKGLMIWRFVLMGTSWNAIFGKYAAKNRTAFLVLSILAMIILGFPALGSIFILAKVKNIGKNQNREENVNL